MNIRRIVAVALTAAATTLTLTGSAHATPEHCNGAPNIYAYGDWECGIPNGYSPWAYIREHDTDSFRRITFDKRTGDYAGRFEVEPGDVPPGTTAERAEVYGLGGGTTLGDERYYAFSIKFATKWKTSEPDSIIVAQWRSANLGATGSPPVAVYTPSGTSDRMRLQLRTGDCTDGSCAYEHGYTVMTGDEFRADRGVWHDFILYVDWSNTVGEVKMWHRTENDGAFTKVIDDDHIPTLQVVDSEIGVTYPKYGIYRLGPQPYTHVLYNDSYCIARLYAVAKSCLPPVLHLQND